MQEFRYCDWSTVFLRSVPSHEAEDAMAFCRLNVFYCSRYSEMLESTK